jgi:hypothetical protein
MADIGEINDESKIQGGKLTRSSSSMFNMVSKNAKQAFPLMIAKEVSNNNDGRSEL